MIDSFLGALYQYSGLDPDLNMVVYTATSKTQRITGMDLLSNSAVNFLSAAITSIFLAMVFYCFWPNSI